MSADVPQPGPEHATLARLVGHWAGDESLHPSNGLANRQRAYGRFHIRMACEGFFLVSDYEQRVDDELVYQGHGIYGWEPSIERFTMFWFDALSGGGAVKPVLGTFEDDRLCFQHAADPDLKRYVYELVSDDEFTFRLETSSDSATWGTRMDGRYRRA